MSKCRKCLQNVRNECNECNVKEKGVILPHIYKDVYTIIIIIPAKIQNKKRLSENKRFWLKIAPRARERHKHRFKDTSTDLKTK